MVTELDDDVNQPADIKTLPLLSEQETIERIFQHIDNRTTDLGDIVWQEPVAHYHSQERFDAELLLLRQSPIPFCPSSALPENGSYIARSASGTPLLVARGNDGVARAFINACRHRGMQVASGQGCQKNFSCPYHAWTYGLDGALKGIPGQAAFPGLDKQEHGLVEVSAREFGGLIYVQQIGQISDEALSDKPHFFTPDQVCFDQSEVADNANWKLITETLLEGYHIKSLHQETFYPFGLDNINVVEVFGANARVVFPFKRIEKLRDLAPEDRKLDGMVTSVYHLFPNASVSLLSKHASLTIMEPLSPTRTRLVSYYVMNSSTDERPITLEAAQRDVEFVNNAGQVEDRAAACAIQETVSTPANPHLTFGYFEKAIVNFHQQLAQKIF